jgi:hypothetical protein
MTHPGDDDLNDDFSSPACSMREADDVYMGYAAKDELARFLDELLQAERAAAQVALESARAAGDAPIGAVLQTMQRDEARWSAMLLGHLKARAEVLASKGGACYDDAMAIADLDERVAFLRANQAALAQKLREMLPRVRDERLHADLSEMLRSQEAQIALASRTGRRLT